jgi:diguanylate cyclase
MTSVPNQCNPHLATAVTSLPDDVLLVGNADTLAAALTAGSHAVSVTCHPFGTAVAHLAQRRYDAVVVAVDGDTASDDAMLRALVSAAGEAPVILIVADDPLQHGHVLRLGVQDCLSRAEATAPRIVRSIVQAAPRKTLERELRGTIDALATAYARMSELATRDPLTGALNRAAFIARVEQALARHARRRTRIALIYLDLDGFKAINDRLGHAAGDQLLVEFHRRVQSCLRQSDMTARLGGDEYAVLIDDVGDRAAAVAAAERMRAAIEQPLSIDGEPVALCASIGVAVSDDALDAAALLRRADHAMYAAKGGKSGVVCFAPDLVHSLERRRAHQSALAALGLDPARWDDALCVTYRPIVHARGTTAWLEARLLWRHPSLGLLPQEDFADCADRSTATRLLRVLLSQIAADATRHPMLAAVAQIWITLPAALQCDAGVAEAAAAFHTQRTAGPVLCVATTARTSQRSGTRWTNALDALRRAGALLALDHFDANDVSLARLTAFPLDYARLSDDATRDIHKNAARRERCARLVRIMHALGGNVVAPPAAPAAAKQTLSAMGCDWLHEDAMTGVSGTGQGRLWVEPKERWIQHGSPAHRPADADSLRVTSQSRAADREAGHNRT